MQSNPLQAAGPDASDVFSISDAVLSERLVFVNEIGSGNWGSVWLCRPKPGAGQDSAAERLRARETKLAVKLVHRAKAGPATDEEKKVAEAASKRVKTLWSEMKIVRTLNEQPHDSIISFQSFIITPSFAMIAMPFLPQLIPVEVPEPRAKEWIHSLLSGVEFIHRRGVVHNDIKPANIMITQRNVPVLIDFGFAEQYDTTAKEAFISNLHYGTPEYISPERASGLPHDTRKSDVWSLGISFFEILVGRTPFEEGEAEQFLTTEDLKKYWSRTVQGKWVGKWKFSTGVERLLARMLAPSADMRCTAEDAMADRYWSVRADENEVSRSSAPPAEASGTERRHRREPKPMHTRPPSVVDIISPWATRTARGRGASGKENAPVASAKRLSAAVSSPRLEAEKKRRSVHGEPLNKAQSQGKMEASLSGQVKPELRKRPAVVTMHIAPSHTEATPARKPLAADKPRPRRSVFIDKPSENVGASAHPVFDAFATPTPPKEDAPRRKAHRDKQSRVARENAAASTAAKENAAPAKAASKRSPTGRKPMGPRVLGSPVHSLKGKPIVPSSEAPAPVLGDRTALSHRAANMQADSEEDGERDMPSGQLDESVVKRMREWERERARMKAMLGGTDDEAEDLNAVAKENDEVKEVGQQPQTPTQDVKEEAKQKPRELLVPARESATRKMSMASSASSPTGPSFSSRSVLERLTSHHEESPVATAVDSGEHTPVNDSAYNLLKQSLKLPMSIAEKTLGHLSRRSISAIATLAHENSKRCLSPVESWADVAISEDEERQGVSPTEKEDRMVAWARSVEKVVKDARQNFATSTPRPVSALPPPPASRRASASQVQLVRRRSSRLPRKVLAANQIFGEDGAPNQTFSSSRTSGYGVELNIGEASMSLVFPGSHARQFPAATIDDVPQTSQRPRRNTIVTRSPKPSGVTRSLDIDRGSPSKRHERSRSQGNLLDQKIVPADQLNLEFDRSPARKKPQRLSALVDRSVFLADLTMNGFEEPRTPEPMGTRDEDDLLASPFHVEPYRTKSRNPSSPIPNTPSRRHTETVYDRLLMSNSGVKRVGQGYQSSNPRPASKHLEPAASKRNFFHSTRRPMPPPVSSDDVRRAASVDELGRVCRDLSHSPTPPMPEGIPTAWRAFKAAVTGKTSRRVPRMEA